MDNATVEKAKELHRHYPRLTFPLDMDRLIIDQGCELVEWPFLFPVKEVIHGRWIGIARGLRQQERRHLVAHALGHRLLHCGNQLWFREWHKTAVWKQEREADEFASHLLMPQDELEKLGNTAPWEIADYFGVTGELVLLRITRFATDSERSRWQGPDGI